MANLRLSVMGGGHRLEDVRLPFLKANKQNNRGLFIWQRYSGKGLALCQPFCRQTNRQRNTVTATRRAFRVIGPPKQAFKLWQIVMAKKPKTARRP